MDKFDALMKLNEDLENLYEKKIRTLEQKLEIQTERAEKFEKDLGKSKNLVYNIFDMIVKAE